LKKEQDAKLEKQNLFIYALSLTIVLLVVIFILIYLSYWQKKKSNKQLNELNEQLGEINSTKDKFFSIIAHDLKSPFLGLMGYSQILSEEYDELKEDEKKTYIGNLYDLTKSSFRLLENLLEWSRLQTGKMDYNPANYNVHNVLFPTLDLLAKTALNKRISMDIQIDEELEVKADKYMLQAVVRNLISNSIKFTQPNGHIIVRAKDTKESIVITVEDDGVGMSQDVVGSLFKIEKNISTKGTANEQGTGLGLLLCKEMVELHTGKIWVESKEGEGTKVFISLP
ncbi:MAG: HAMP domain-containing sensor histidine kinase, partial [Bacteroidota bacterium]|nr:HAMP domain-containing sensor histidine kinase [Bacteroidota bacterium]